MSNENCPLLIHLKPALLCYFKRRGVSLEMAGRGSIAQHDSVQF